MWETPIERAPAQLKTHFDGARLQMPSYLRCLTGIIILQKDRLNAVDCVAVLKLNIFIKGFIRLSDIFSDQTSMKVNFQIFNHLLK